MRQCKIWQIPEPEFREIVARSTSYSDILRKIGTSQGGDHYHMVKERIAFLKLEASHLLQGVDIVRRRLSETKIPLQDILVEHSSYPRIHLKPRLIADGLLKNKCAICSLSPYWEGKDLVLAMDHINGVKDDHRLGNLRLLCPNCHSQTETFANRNVKKRKKATVGKPSRHHGNRLKKRLIEFYRTPYQCALCGRGPEWNGKKLTLEVDHVNGVNNDHQPENLRFLCPNCHSQTATFAGKHIPKPKKEYICRQCGAGITQYSKTGFCPGCVSKSRRKVDRPPRAVLAQLVAEHGFVAIGRRFGVSDNAVRKWLR